MGQYFELLGNLERVHRLSVGFFFLILGEMKSLVSSRVLPIWNDCQQFPYDPGWGNRCSCEICAKFWQA